MGFEHKYPYSDFHELNLDWILGIVKRLESEWPEFKTTLETEWNEYKDGLTGEGGEWPTFKTQIETTVNNLIHDVVGPYNENLDYKMGMFCYYEGNVYKCNLGSSAAFPRPFNSYSWFSYAGQNTNSIVNDLFNYLTNSLDSQDTEIFRWIQNTAAQWDETTEYKAGDYCSALVGGAFNPASWRYYRCLQDCTNIYIFDTNYWKEVIFASDVADRIADYKQAMQDQYDQFLADYQRQFGVVQTRGSSTTDVMSQKAVSDELQAHDDMIDNLINDIAPEYDSTKSYKIGNLLTYLGKQYYCITDAPAGTLPTNTTYFEEKSVADIIEMIKTGAITVGKANLANNFDSKMVLTDNSGYLYRTTGGSLEVGEQNRVKKIIGASVPIIQVVIDGDFSSGAGWNTSGNGVAKSIANKQLTITHTSSNAGSSVKRADITFIQGHRYMVSLSVKSSDKTAINTMLYDGSTSYNFEQSGITSAFKTYTYFLVPNHSTSVGQLQLYRTYSSGENGTAVFQNVFIVDLTATFGTTVANRLATLETAQAGTGIAKAKEILVKDYYPYNVTAFTHTKTTGKQNVGFNQLKAQPVKNDVIVPFDSSTFNELIAGHQYEYNIQSVTGATSWRFCVSVYDKNGNVVTDKTIAGFPNTFYYSNEDRTFRNGDNVTNTVFKVTPTIDCYMYINFGYGDTSSSTKFNNPCLHLVWDGERDGEYEPYQEWNYPVEDIELKGILSLDAQDNWVADGDVYLPSGVVDEKYRQFVPNVTADNYVDIGGWLEGACSIRVPMTVANSAKIGQVKCLSPIWPDVVCTYSGDSSYFYFKGAASVWTTKEAVKNAVNGKDLLYPLENPTESTADPYTELQNDSNWGTEKWIDTRDVPMPVFSTCEYIPDLKAKLETAPESPDEDGDYIMHRENGLNSYGSLSTWLSANGYNKLQDLLTAFGANGMVGGTLRNVLANKLTIDFNNTKVIDMGSINWTKDNLGCMYVRLGDYAEGTSSKCVCTKYKVVTVATSGQLNNLEMGIDTAGYILVRDNTYTDASTFKEAMKGVLLAYEKAST